MRILTEFSTNNSQLHQTVSKMLDFISNFFTPNWQMYDSNIL